MAQTRYINWKDLRKSDVINRKDLGVLAPGLYRGFEYDGSSSGTSLVLSHLVTGYSETNEDGTARTNVGMVKTKQGVVVTEDAAITVSVTNNSGGTNPRLDYIILQHVYIETSGGTVAGYSQVIGTPASTPVPPSLPFPLTSIILGTIYWPAHATDIDGVGVVYTKAYIPSFAEDMTVMKTDKIQTSTALKTFNTQKGFISTSATISSAVLSFGELSNHFQLSDSLFTGLTAPLGISAIGFNILGYTLGLGPSSEYKIYTPGILRLDDTYPTPHNIHSPGGSIFIPADTVFVIKDITGFDGTSNQAFMVVDNSVVLNRPVVHTAVRIGAYTQPITLASGGRLPINALSNSFSVSTTLTDLAAIGGLAVADYTVDSTGGNSSGTIITIALTNTNPLAMRFNAGGYTWPYKKILSGYLGTPNQHIFQPGIHIITLIELSTGWYIISVTGDGDSVFDMQPYPWTAVTSFGDPGFTNTGNAAKWTYDNAGRVSIVGLINATVGAMTGGGTGNIIFNGLPHPSEDLIFCGHFRNLTTGTAQIVSLKVDTTGNLAIINYNDIPANNGELSLCFNYLAM